jgi:hypothetical protein
MDVLKKVFDYSGDGDIVNIQLISFNKEQQQIEGTFKLRQFYLV